MEEALAKHEAELQTNRENYTLLMKSLAKTDDEEKKIDIQAKQIALNAESTLLSLQLVVRERQRVENELATMQSAETNLHKAILTLSKENEKMLKDLHQKENDGFGLENDLAKLKLEKLRLQAEINQLSIQSASEAQEIKAKENTIAKFQADIRQRNDDIEKKVFRVDRLNKRYERMLESVGGEENLNSLENNIKALNDSADAITAESQEVKRSWLSKQTELVGVLGDTERLLSKQTELKARVAVLTQQRERFEAEQGRVISETKASLQKNSELRKEMVRLNSLTSLQSEEEGRLHNANINIESAFSEEDCKLREECASLRVLLDGLYAGKAALADELHEADHQSLLWEKRLQLDREMREALQPLVGQDDIEGMEREIHRMSLRLDAIKKHQSSLSLEMEAAVLKRETIASRYKPQSTQGNATAKRTQAQPSRTGANSSRAINALTEEATAVDAELLQKEQAAAAVRTELDDMRHKFSELRVEFESTERSMKESELKLKLKLYEKSYLVDKHLIYNKLLDRSRSLAGPEAGQSSSRAAGARSLNRVLDVIRGLRERHPPLEGVLTQIEGLATLEL